MTGNYEIGYGRPPRAHQFPAGRSGNPKGSKGRPPIDISQKLTEPIPFSVNGKAERATPFEAGLLSMVAKAAKGHMRSAKKFLDHCQSAGLFERPEETDDHQYVLRIPKDWDDDEWMSNFNQFGPPPWQGERDGLTDAARKERELGRRAR